MPRDGSGVYSAPGGTGGSPNTTILSSMFNAYVADITADLNAARPIAAGGTGGTSVMTGWDGLAAKGADIASSSTIDLDAATGPSISITGTATIATVTLTEGRFRLARAAGAFTLDASASLIVNGSTSADLTVTANDLLLFRGGAAGVVSVARLGTAAATSGISGALGATDNAVLRADGTGGQTAQGSAVAIDDSGNITGAGTIDVGNADTTVSRGAAGFIAVEGKRVPSPASQAAGDMLYRGGTEWERLAKGTAGQHLVMNAGATAPEWQDQSGAMTLLGTITTTSGTSQALTSIASGYRQFYCELEGVSPTGGSALELALSSTNGAAYGTSASVAASATGTGSVWDGAIIINAVSSTVAAAKTAMCAVCMSGATPTVGTIAAPTNSAAVVNAIRFSISGGGNSFDAGTIRVYGIR